MARTGSGYIKEFIKEKCKERKVLVEPLLRKVAENTGETVSSIHYMYNGWKPMERKIAEEMAKYINATADEIIEASLIKKEETFDELPFWIKRNIDEYGNCYIPDKIYKRYGKEALIAELERETGKRLEMIEFKVGAYGDGTDDFENLPRSRKIDHVIQIK